MFHFTDFVNENVETNQRLARSVYRRTLTQMCNTMRNPKKK